MVNGYAGLSERKFRKWVQMDANTPLCHSERSEESRLERPRRSSLGPRAVSRRSSEQGERKSGCPSEASYLIFRPASVATACEAHEALTFWLLLGQAKSDKKEILRFALNDKLMVNGYAWYTVSERGGTSPPAPLQRGEERSEGGCYPFKGGRAVKRKNLCEDLSPANCF